MHARHARYFARCADLRWPDLVGGTGWREVVQLEHENFHAAHDWALAHGDADTALAIGSGVWPFWMSHYARQSRRWLEEALALGGPRSERRAHVLVGLADFAKFQGDLAAAEQASSEALAIFRARGERRWEAAAISTLADLALMRDDVPTARRLAEKSVSLRREIGSFGLGRGLASVAEVAVAEGRLDEAQAHLKEALEWQRASRPQSVQLAYLLSAAGGVALRCGDLDGAHRLLVESVQIAARLQDDDHLVGGLDALANLAAAVGDPDRAARLGGCAERIIEELGFVRSRFDLPPPERIEPAWSEGRAMSTDEAVAYALASID